jgi:hypothetical protein
MRIAFAPLEARRRFTPFRPTGPDSWRSLMMKQHVVALAALGFLVALGWIACDKGPMQQTGEKLDRATDQDRLIGKGPLEKAGRNMDDAVKDLQR